MPHNGAAIEDERVERAFGSTVAFYPRARNIASDVDRVRLLPLSRCGGVAREGLRAAARGVFSHNRVPLRVPMAGSPLRLPSREIVHIFAGHDRADPETHMRLSTAA